MSYAKCGLDIYFVFTIICLCVAGLNADPQLTSGSVGVSGVAGPDSGCSQDGVRYLSVMWCKASKKKHKRWEGDAVLITRGRTATLKDMEGKDIGKGETETPQFRFSLYLLSY